MTILGAHWRLFAALLPLCASEFVLLDPEDYKEHFTEGSPSPSAGQVNESTFRWAQEQIPFFEVDNADILAAYYFRVKSYRSHLIHTEFTDCPWVVSEFGPAVHWGGAYGTINAAAGHQIREGRWIRDPVYMDSFARFWFGGGTFANKTKGQGNGAYSSWIISAAVERAKVKGSLDFLQDKLEAMVAWFDGRTKSGRQDCVFKDDQGGWPVCQGVPPNASKWPQCYAMLDGWDAMEGSISGAGCRPTINSMMFAEAEAIATIANSLNQTELAANFTRRAEFLRETILDVMWSDELQFFAVYKINLFNNERWKCSYNGTIVGDSSSAVASTAVGRGKIAGCPPMWPCNHTVTVRELLGLSPPWYFGVVPETTTGKPTKYEAAWKVLFDPVNGFEAKFGPTTAERQHKCFNMSQDGSECSWNGMSWPYETARVLTAMSNLLIDRPSAQSAGTGVDAAAFTKLVTTYATSHTQGYAANGSQPWVGENIEPDRGFWVAREIMYEGGNDPSPVNCTACAADPRPRNCGGRTTFPSNTDPSWTGFGACCDTGAKKACDGEVLPTVDRERGKDYDHSTFVDVVISGLVGFRPSLNDEFTLHPLVDVAAIGRFAIDNIAYHGHNITVAFAKTGAVKGAWKGCAVDKLCVWIDGEVVSTTHGLAPVTIAVNVN